MLYAKTALLSLLAAAATAAPVPEEAQSMTATTIPQWTITNFKRTCNNEDTACSVEFGVDTHLAPVTGCAYTVTANAQASRAPVNGVSCGPYQVSSGWSGQFGEGNGFTTWSVVDFNQRLIVWPAYTDKQLVNGQVVKPDQSYAPQSINW